MSCTMCSGPIWPSINMSRPTHCAYALCHHSISISRFAPTFGNITIASDESGDPHTKGSVLMGEPRPQKKEKHRNSPAEKCPYWVDKATHADIWVIKSWPTRRQLQAKLLCTYECRVVHVDDIPSREYSGSPTGGSDFTPVNTHDTKFGCVCCSWWIIMNATWWLPRWTQPLFFGGGRLHLRLPLSRNLSNCFDCTPKSGTKAQCLAEEIQLFHEFLARHWILIFYCIWATTHWLY